MTLHHLTVPDGGMGIGAGFGLLDTYLTIGDASGRVVFVIVKDAEHLLITLDDATPAKCPRCGHDEALDPSRRPNGDHIVRVVGPMSFDRVGVNQEANHVTFKVSEPFLFVWCSEYEPTMRTLRPTIERQPHG